MLLVGVVGILFAASNRTPVDLELWPLPFAVTVPVYGIALAAIAFGVVWGGLIGWFAAVRARRRARVETRRADAAEHDMRLLREKIDALEHRPQSPT